MKTEKGSEIKIKLLHKIYNFYDPIPLELIAFFEEQLDDKILIDEAELRVRCSNCFFKETKTFCSIIRCEQKLTPREILGE